MSFATFEFESTVYNELREVAGKIMRGERRDHTLQATCLVNEAFLRLRSQLNINPGQRTAFLAAAANTMRRVLIDHARARAAQIRGGNAERKSMSRIDLSGGEDPFEMVAFDDVLTRFAAKYPRAARVVELRVFGGLTAQETAAHLGVAKGTVDNDWRFASAWLGAELRPVAD